MLDRLQTVAGQVGATMPQTALAWMLSRPGITAPIAGASRREHLNQAVDAVGVQLSSEQVKMLEEPYRPNLVLGH